MEEEEDEEEVGWTSLRAATLSERLLRRLLVTLTSSTAELWTAQVGGRVGSSLGEGGKTFSASSPPGSGTATGKEECLFEPISELERRKCFEKTLS